MRGAAQKQRTALGNIAESGQAVPHAGPVLPRVAFSYLPGEPCLPEWENARVGQETPQSPGQAEGIGGTGVSAGKDVCLKGWTFQAVQGIVVSQCSERFDPKEDKRQCQT